MSQQRRGVIVGTTLATQDNLKGAKGHIRTGPDEDYRIFIIPVQYWCWLSDIILCDGYCTVCQITYQF